MIGKRTRTRVTRGSRENECVVPRPSLRVVEQLVEEYRRDVDRHVHFGMLQQQRGHGVIVAESVQSHPWHPMIPGRLRGRVVPVPRLVEVPEEGDGQPVPQRQGQPRAHNRLITVLPADRILDLFTRSKWPDARTPVTVGDLRFGTMSPRRAPGTSPVRVQ